jgi:diguanylate cyclase (GGDEF)-like protein/PAS domain S-box-containing protein
MRSEWSPRGAIASDVGVLHRVLLGVSAALILVVGVGTLTGWELLTRVRPEWPAIYPYTVVGLLAMLTAMVLFGRGGRTNLVIGRILASIPLLFGLLVEPLIRLGWIPTNDPANADFSLATLLPSLAVVALSASVLLLGFPSDRLPRVRFGLAVFAGVIALLGLLSYVYGSNTLFTTLGLTGTSLPTTVIGLCMVGAVLSARPDHPPLDQLDQHYDASMLRRLVPLVLMVPFVPAVIGWFAEMVVVDDRTAVAVAQLTTVVVLLVTIVVLSVQQSRSRQEVVTERQRLWQAFASTPAATAMLDTEGRIVLANANMSRLFQRDPDELVGTYLIEYVNREDQASVREGLLQIAWGADVVRQDVRVTDPHGTWVDAGFAAVRDTMGHVSDVVVQMTDLTDRKRLEQVLYEQALSDPLTGLLNREGLTREIETRLDERRDGQVLAVVYADVDDLKVVNDSIGHAAGDDLLREVARRLQSCTREDDVLARVGGDEFVVVTWTKDFGTEPAAVVLSRLRDELSGPVAVGREIVTMSVSLGASLVADGDVAEAVLRADAAMYEDKRRRRRSSTT